MEVLQSGLSFQLILDISAIQILAKANAHPYLNISYSMIVTLKALPNRNNKHDIQKIY